MDHSNSQNMSQARSRLNSQDRSNVRRVRSNSIRDITSDREEQRSRTSSIARSDVNSDLSRYNRARGPVNDAVHTALDPIDPSHTTISPEVINQITSQITEKVLETLKATQFPPTTPTTQHSADHAETISSVGISPPIDQDEAYIPAPYRASEEAAQSTSPTSPRRASVYSSPPGPKRPPSPPFSHGGLSEDSDAKEGKSYRPRTDRTSSSGESTVLEKIWGLLFDEKSEPTKRLSQFLRGTAVHLIEDYEPKHSLVVTPDKMQKYYSETKLANEIYPWQVIFDDRTSSISRMYRELEAQHHLVQDDLNERPDIPGLTPQGFETWMTIVLRAHPSEEFERLAYTALHMPVSNPDDRKERFPKELLRRQFPKDASSSLATNLEKTIYTHCGVRKQGRNGSISEKDNKPIQPSLNTQDLPLQPGVTSQKPVLTEGYSLSQQTTRSSAGDIDRNALRATVSEAAVEDSPIEIVPPPQLERERKPYYGQSGGGGKIYDDMNTQNPPMPEISASQSYPPPPAKLSRSSSTNGARAQEGRIADIKPRTQPISIHQKPSHQSSYQPPQQVPYADTSSTTRPRRGSGYHRDPPRRTDRNRSPSASRTNDYTHKSDEGVGYGTYQPSRSIDYASNSYRSEDRYEHRGSISGEQRQRYQSMSSGDGGRHYNKDLPNDEEYYRSSNGGYRPDATYPPPHQFPPTSYKGRA